ncbi:MAG: hypothetical protein R2771_13450 [Saprospiraceae bacterium]
MLNFSFFKTNKPRKFEPIPRFYDPDKEYIDSIKKRIDDKDDVEALKYKLKQNFGKNRFGSSRISDQRLRRANRNSNIRLVVILVVLLILTYYYLISG